MASNRIPGVQVKEIDVSEVVVPAGTNVGALVGRTPKGPTNQRVLVGNNKSFVTNFGAPVKGDSTEFPIYAAIEFLTESDALWFTRPATMADKVGNLKISVSSSGEANWVSSTQAEAPENGVFSVDGYEDGNKPNKYWPGEQDNQNALTITALGASKENSDIGVIIVTEANVETSSIDYTYGYTWEGKYPEKNASNEPVHYYRINVYVKASNQTAAEAGWDGLNPLKTLVPAESWIVSNDPTAKDYSGNSMYVKDVVNGYSSYIYVNTNGSDFVDSEVKPIKAYPVGEYKVVEDSETLLPKTAIKIDGQGPNFIDVIFSNPSAESADGKVEIVMDVALSDTSLGTLSESEGQLVLTDSEDNEGTYRIENWTVVAESAASPQVKQELVAAVEPTDVITVSGITPSIEYVDEEETQQELFVVSGGSGTITVADENGMPQVITSKAPWFKVSGDSFVHGLGSGDYKMASADDGIVAAWNALYRTKEQVTPNLLIAPYVGTNDIDTGKVKAVCDIATSRRDCFAVVPASGMNVTKAQAIIDGLDNKSYMRNSYCGIYAGADLVFDQYTNRNIYLPKVCFAARIIAHSANVGNIWDAPAGTTRGAMNTLDQLTLFTEEEIGTMYNKGINTSKRIRGAGDYMWGQKTGQVKASALDRINVRRLLLYIENTLEPQLADYLFDVNTDVIQSRVKTNIDQFLETIYAGGGLYNWKVVCDSTNNTPYSIDNYELNVDVYVQPVKTIEFINLNIIITRTGVSFTEA